MAKRRKRGEGSVHLRKDGRWEGRVVVGYDDKGLPITKNVLAKTKTACLDKLKTLQETCSGQPTEKLQPDITFGEWLDFWYQNYSKPKLRSTTQAGYENAIYKHIIPALGKILLSELSTNDLQQFYTGLKKKGRLIRTELYGEGVSDRTVWSCHTRIRTALDRAVQDGLIRINPAADCKLPPQNTKEMKVLSREEMQRFLIQAKEEGYFELFLLELATGLRRLFVTTALENGMDVKTLSTIIGHVSAKTTLNVYTHVTDAMRQTAAAKIDQGIGKCKLQNKANSGGEGFPTQAPDTRPVATFEPYKGKNRKRGTGCLTQINEHLWEGRYSPRWPDGKIHSRSVYATTSEGCEEKLAGLIRQMKAEVAEAKRLAAEGKWEEAMALAVQTKARGTRKMDVLA